jgi:hypothetical protein
MLRELRLGAAWMLALTCACDLGIRSEDTETMTGAGSEGSGGSGTTGPEPTLACGEETQDDKGNPLIAHSSFDEEQRCWCDDGYTWNDPFDPNDYACHEVAPRLLGCGQACDATAIASGQVACEGDTEAEGFTQDQACDCPIRETWCAPDDPKNHGPKDTRCCSDGAQRPAVGGSSSETGTTESAGTSGSSDGSSGGTTAPGTSEQ